MADWTEVEKRLPQDEGVRIRLALLEHLRSRTSFKPEEVLAKVVVLADSQGRRMLWGYGSAGIQNLYLGPEAVASLPKHIQLALPLKKHSARTTYLGAYEGPTLEIRNSEDLLQLAPFSGTGLKEAGRSLSRDSIEAAMDAFDSYIATGAHSEVFEQFGEPRDYWVRSTRPRSNRIYPSKPIHFWVNGQKPSSGGWGGPGYSAAALHNAGYIIVDADGTPVPVPKDRDHLIRDATRIRLCAFNYYIAPAREREENSVSIRAGTLNKELMLNEAWPNVCQALKGKMFQELADVPEPTQSGPDDSTTTTFTYELFDHRKNLPMNTKTNEHPPTATNLILYGPPGTGKTYATAWEAVRLCVGDDATVRLRNDRNALMVEYRRLVGKGRIEFVTFHQSLSYEDFVEGLRPMTSTGSDSENSAGFRLEPVPGIFQRISKRAEESTGELLSGDAEHEQQEALTTLEGCNVHQMSHDHTGESSDEQGFDEPWDQTNTLLNLEDVELETRAAGPLFKVGNLPPVQLGTFRHLAQDVAKQLAVIYPRGFALNQYRDALVQAGKITGKVPTGGWENHNMPEWASHPKQEWLELIGPANTATAAQEEIHDSTMNSGRAGSSSPITRADHYVLIIDEINRANISKVFGELITLLEQDKRLGAPNELRVQLPYSKKHFGVPPNLHIIGTMNTADRSIALLDTALRRRFAFHELMPDPSVLSEHVDGINLQILLTTINERIEYLFDREHQIGHAYFMGCRNREDVENVMRHKVIPLLAEYFYEDWSKVAAVLGDGFRAAKAHFLEARNLSSPAGFGDDELGGEKLRWSVKAEFDFSEFEA